MALKFIDSFDVYGTQGTGTLASRLAQKYTTFDNTGSNTTSRFVTGRNGGSAFLFSGTSFKTYNLGNNATWIIGFGFFNNGYTGTNLSILSVIDASTEQVHLSFNGATGFISAFRGATLLGTGTKKLVTSTWYYVELKVTINSSSGQIITHINQTADLSLTSQNTQVSGNAFANTFSFGGSASGNGVSSWSFDDLYICDGSGSANNDFLGDMTVEAVLPDTTGSNTGWLPVGAVDNFQDVNDPSPDGTEFVYSSTVNALDTYHFSPLTRVATSIAGIMVNVLARRSDSTAHSVATVVKTSGTNVGTTQSVPDTARNYVTQIYEVDPSDGVTPWNSGLVDGAEFGVKLIS
jgi:hypothetical protein